MEKKEDIFEIITSDEAMVVLHRFMDKHAEYNDEIRGIALKLLSDTDSKTIARDVRNSLDCLDVEELWDRSGSTRYGYVEPTEEAWDMVEEALYEFVDGMVKYQKSGLQKLAKTYCIGIIKGIKDYDSNSNSQFKDWAVDAPYEHIDKIFEKWKENTQDKKDIAQVKSIKDN